MKYPWIILVALAGLATMFIIAFIRRKNAKQPRNKKKDFKPLANTISVRNLPEYKAAEKKYRLLIALSSILFLVSFMSTAILASRPIAVDTKRPEYENRDIMLCLDISGSMTSYIKALLNYFKKIVKDFEGQRVGITIFDGVYMPVAPLSDDYDMLSDLFDDISNNPSSYLNSLYYVNSNAGSSAIGPGLIGCVDSFDRLEESRSRAIIFATDNYAQENQLVSLTQAANYAKRYDIAVYGLSTSEWRSQQEIDNGDKDAYETASAKEFRESMLLTGGAYYAFSDRDSIDGTVTENIVNQILKQAAARHEGAETLIETDTPIVFTLIMILSLAAFFYVSWRLSL